MKRVFTGFLTAMVVGAGLLYLDTWLVGWLFGSETPFLIFAVTVICCVAFLGMFTTGQKAQTFETIFGLLVGMYGWDFARVAFLGVDGRVF